MKKNYPQIIRKNVILKDPVLSLLLVRFKVMPHGQVLMRTTVIPTIGLSLAMPYFSHLHDLNAL